MTLHFISGSSIFYESIPEQGNYRLFKSIILQDERTGAIYGVPSGFLCDGASIPFILPETGPCEAGGFVHDFAYRFGFVYIFNTAESRWNKSQLTRAQADEFYRATCRAYGSHRLWAFVQWAFLRACPITWFYWHQRRRWALDWQGNAPTRPIPPANTDCGS